MLNYRPYVASLSFAYLFLVIFSTLSFTFSNPLFSPIKQFAAAIAVAFLFSALWYVMSGVIVLSYKYLEETKGSKEESAFQAISKSLTVIFASVLVFAFLNIFRLPPPGGLYNFLSVAIHFIAAYLAIIFFFYIGKAGIRLSKIAGQYTKIKNSTPFVFVLVSLVCVLAWPHIISGASANTPSHILQFLSAPVFLILIYLPMLFAWVYGVLGAIGIYLYNMYIPGVIYKKSLVMLSFGLVLFTVTSLARQLSAFTFGLTGQEFLVEEFPRTLFIFGMAIATFIVVRHSFRMLIKIEKVK